MPHPAASLISFLETIHPYDNLDQRELETVAASLVRSTHNAGDFIYQYNQALEGIYIIESGVIDILDSQGAHVTRLFSSNSFGERGILRDGFAATTARAFQPVTLWMLSATQFRKLLKEYPAFERFFGVSRHTEGRTTDIASLAVSDLTARSPISCGPDTSTAQAARLMRDAQISSLGVVEPDTECLIGVITVRDLANRVLANELSPETPVSHVMTRNPVSLPSSALGADVLHLMLEKRVGHLPIVDHGRFTGMITQTDLTRFQAVSTTRLARDIAAAPDILAMTTLTARIPQMLVQLVSTNQSHTSVTRMITDITDVVTRRLLTLAEERLGPPPVPYAWLACGSQGRQEQTGVSDQDNCLLIDNSLTENDQPWFEQLARFVCDGLNACGYVYCPGDMMATTPRWRQPLHVWRQYFRTWATHYTPETQMLASVMFDLRPIGGAASLHEQLMAETLDMASKNSIFVAHMIANSLKHTPPLGLIRGFSTLRSGNYRNHIDMKHNGVIPVVDLARVYALQGRLQPVNTRARLLAAGAAGIISESGARDLVDAYDLIATLRLENQARQVRAGHKPVNYLAPADLSDFERNHLRDAFVVVRTMQSALGHDKHILR